MHARENRRDASGCSSSGSPSGFQHEGSAEGLHSCLQGGRVADAAEVRDWDPGAVEVLLLQQLILQQADPSATTRSHLLWVYHGTLCRSGPLLASRVWDASTPQSLLARREPEGESAAVNADMQTRTHTPAGKAWQAYIWVAAGRTCMCAELLEESAACGSPACHASPT